MNIFFDNLFGKKSKTKGEVEIVTSSENKDIDTQSGKAEKWSVAYIEDLTSPIVAGSNYLTLFSTIPEVFFPIDYNGDKDVIVEFAEPQDLILDGMSITFAGAAVLTELNKTHALVKMEDGRILIPGVAFSGAETATDKMTFSVHEAGFKNIEEPNSEDVVKTAFAAMTYAQYFPNAIILNPMTVNGMESEKDTTGRNLGIVKMVDGVKYIAGRPIIEYGGILPGKYLLGDFNQAANLVDYTTLTLEWAEDVETKLCNEVVLMAQEEVIFPIYMPWAFAYGDLAALKTAITKA